MLVGVDRPAKPSRRPVYISEIAPAAVRGLCTAIFTGFVYLGIVLAYFANYGCAVHLDADGHARWLVPTSLHLIMSGIVFLLTMMHAESPRFLVSKGRPDEAARVLAHLRRLPADGDYVTRDVAAIQAALDRELEATRGIGWLGKLREMLLVPSNLYRVYLSTMVQLFSQWSGAGSITLVRPVPITPVALAC